MDHSNKFNQKLQICVSSSNMILWNRQLYFIQYDGEKITKQTVEINLLGKVSQQMYLIPKFPKC